MGGFLTGWFRSKKEVGLKALLPQKSAFFTHRF
jgi:hypothetical protein